MKRWNAPWVVALLAVAITICGGQEAGGCDGDTNGDGIVNVTDLVNVILCWTATTGSDGVDCPGPGINTDLNDDGVVDVLDLVASPQSVILNWGLCPLLNDDCEVAQTLIIDDPPVAGSTASATDDPEPVLCFVPSTAPGVWYRVIGDGSELTVSMCSSPTTYDSILTVYCGPCDAPLCVASNDDGCGVPGDATLSERSWCSEAGQEYLILVSGFGGATGDFRIAVNSTGSCTQPVCLFVDIFDNCETPLVIGDGLHDFTTSFTSTDGPENPPDTCNDFGENQTWNDRWYEWTATMDGLVLVTTCPDVDPGSYADYNTDLVIYDATSADCPMTVDDILACNDDDPNNPCGTGPPFASTIFAPVLGGSTYLIRVGGWGQHDFGEGRLSVQNLPAESSLCIVAEDLTPGDTVSLDNTTVSSFGDPGPEICPGATQANENNGRWARIVGTGNELTIEVCAVPFNAYDTQTSIYCTDPLDGTCDTLTCADVDEPADNALCDPQTERFVLQSELDRVYYVRVGSAIPGANGVADVTLTEGGPAGAPPCQPCLAAGSCIGDLTESEPCLVNGDDDENGGCNMAGGTEMFAGDLSGLTLPATVCGVTSTYVNSMTAEVRDTDWWIFTPAVSGDYTWSMETEFEGHILVGRFVTAPGGVPDCSTDTDLDGILGNFTIGVCASAQEIVYTMTAGETYLLFASIRTAAFGGQQLDCSTVPSEGGYRCTLTGP